MIKEFLFRKLLKSQLKNVPEAEQQKILTLVEKNPELFKQIATEVQAKMAGGKDQMSAVMEVMQAHKAELEAVMGKQDN
jgi:hypothetical protein